MKLHVPLKCVRRFHVDKSSYGTHVKEKQENNHKSKEKGRILEEGDYEGRGKKEKELYSRGTCHRGKCVAYA